MRWKENQQGVASLKSNKQCFKKEEVISGVCLGQVAESGVLTDGSGSNWSP